MQEINARQVARDKAIGKKLLEKVEAALGNLSDLRKRVTHLAVELEEIQAILWDSPDEDVSIFGDLLEARHFLQIGADPDVLGDTVQDQLFAIKETALRPLFEQIKKGEQEETESGVGDD
jgi:hypothetical protein